MQASKVTSPSRSGNPPLPTDEFFTSASSIIHPCSTASKEIPPLSKTSHALAVAFGTFHVAITMGFTLVEFTLPLELFFSMSDLHATTEADATTPIVDKEAL